MYLLLDKSHCCFLANVSSGATLKKPTLNPPEVPPLSITKTVAIAVCSAVAYLALVIGLSVYCSVRLMKKKRTLQISKKGMVVVLL